MCFLISISFIVHFITVMKFCFAVVECVEPAFLVQLNSDDQDGTFETTDNYEEGSPNGPTETSDASVPVFGLPSTIQPDTVNQTPYTITIKTPEGTDDTPMAIDATTVNVVTIRVIVGDNTPLEVKYTLLLHNNLISDF